MVFFVAALTASSAGTFVVGTIVAVPSCTSHLSAFLATERSILTTSVPVSFGPPTGTVFPFGAAPCLVKKGGHDPEYTHQSRDIFNYLVGTGSRITILLSRMNRGNNNVSLIVSFQLSNCFFCFFFQR